MKTKKKRKHYTAKNSLTKRKGNIWAHKDRARRMAENERKASGGK